MRNWRTFLVSTQMILDKKRKAFIFNNMVFKHKFPFDWMQYLIFNAMENWKNET